MMTLDIAKKLAQAADQLTDRFARSPTRAETFLDGLTEREKSELVLPQIADKAEALQIPVAIFRSERVAECVGLRSTDVSRIDGGLVMFPDHSFLWIDDRSIICETPAQVATDRDFDPGLFTRAGFALIHNSVDLVAGASEEATPGEAEYLLDILTQIETLSGADVDLNQMQSQQDFDDADCEEMRRALEIICVGLLGMRPAAVRIGMISACEGKPLRFVIKKDATEETQIATTEISRTVSAAMPHLIDLSRFRGYDWRMTGDHMMRASSWTKHGIYISGIFYNGKPKRLSNHEILMAPEILENCLLKAGKSRDEISRLLST